MDYINDVSKNSISINQPPLEDVKSIIIADKKQCNISQEASVSDDVASTDIERMEVDGAKDCAAT